MKFNRSNIVEKIMLAACINMASAMATGEQAVGYEIEWSSTHHKELETLEKRTGWIGKPNTTQILYLPQYALDLQEVKNRSERGAGSSSVKLMDQQSTEDMISLVHQIQDLKWSPKPGQAKVISIESRPPQDQIQILGLALTTNATSAIKILSHPRNFFSPKGADTKFHIGYRVLTIQKATDHGIAMVAFHARRPQNQKNKGIYFTPDLIYFYAIARDATKRQYDLLKQEIQEDHRVGSQAKAEVLGPMLESLESPTVPEGDAE
ncbi:MAG: hypothetical protein LBJ92_01525 [Holosporales bacterium]|jgi:hypothetical protein|nr:hypothetical protein [Holosporales bacterium]